jgi:hypothetical protein
MLRVGIIKVAQAGKIIASCWSRLWQANDCPAHAAEHAGVELAVVVPAIAVGFVCREDGIKAFARICDAKIRYQHQCRGLAIDLINIEDGLPGPWHETVRAIGAV